MLTQKLFPALFPNPSHLQFVWEEFQDIYSITVGEAIERKRELIERFKDEMDFYACDKDGFVYDCDDNVVGICEDYFNIDYYIVVETILSWLEKRDFRSPPKVIEIPEEDPYYWINQGISFKEKDNF